MLRTINTRRYLKVHFSVIIVIGHFFLYLSDRACFYGSCETREILSIELNESEALSFLVVPM